MESDGTQPLSRRQAKKLATRRNILEAASRLFMELGYEGTTVEQISQEAGISKPTFFSYFPAKSMVLSALVEDAHEHFVMEAQLQLSTSASTRERLCNLFEASSANIVDNSELSKLLVSNSFRLFVEDHDTSGSRMLDIRDSISALLSEGRRQGDINTDLDLAAQVKLVSGIYIETLFEWLSAPNASSPQEQLRKAAELASNLLSPKGAISAS